MMIDDFDTQVQSDELGEETIEEADEVRCRYVDSTEEEEVIKTEAKYLYFNVPTQVRFLDLDADEEYHDYCNGIAFQDFVICGCCGGVFDLKELYDLAEEVGIPAEKVIIPYDSWRDLNSLIEE